MMAVVADDIRNFETGEKPGSPTGFEQGWFSHVRARKALGDTVKKAPFVRFWPGGRTAASPMVQDKLTAVADAVGWRTVNPEQPPVVPEVTDVGDMIMIGWEVLKLIVPPAILVQAVSNAKKFNKWPAAYSATEAVADFEKGT